MSSAAATIESVQAAPRTRAPVNKWVVAISVTFGTLMGAIDASIVNVAIPHLQGALGATLQQITWVTTGFTIANVIVMPLTAFLASFFGQKRIYMFCLGLFVVGSVFCGMASSLVALILFRIIQGMGAGALQPTEQAILRQTFPLREQGMAMAVFGMAVMIGPAVGPTLGGWIVDNFSWPWIFFINVPVGITGLIMVWRNVHEPEDVKAANRARAEKQKKHMDWAGIGLLSIAVATFEYVLEEGNRDGWFHSPLICLLAAVAAISFVSFLIRELTATVPAVRIQLFKNKTFVSCTLVSAVMFAVMLANMFLLPVFMQELMGYTATQSGLALMPRVLTMMLIVPFVGRLYNYVQPRYMVLFGVLMQVLGAFMMSHYTLATSTWGLIAPLIVQGLGMACLFIPLSTAAISTIPRTELTDATGLYSLFRQIGASFGLAIFATLLDNFQVRAAAGVGAHVVRTDHFTLGRLGMLTHALMAKGFDAVSAHLTALKMVKGLVEQQGMVIAFEKTFLLGGIAFLAVLPLLLFMKVEGHAQLRGASHDSHVEI